MEKIENSVNGNNFFSNPKIVENYALLQEIGVFAYIDSLDQEINNYKNLFAGALDIVNRTTIIEIIDAAVWQISDHFLPSVIVFLWRRRVYNCFTEYKQRAGMDIGETAFLAGPSIWKRNQSKSF
jgi:hypothetical protein